MSAIARVVVAIPAHNEERLLPWCLEGVLAAREHLRQRDATATIEVDLVVALDGCTDRSAEMVRRHAPAAVAVRSPRLGVAGARDLAIATALARHPDETGRIWVACTDADTRVGPGWLTRQVAMAEAGAEVVVGTVEPVGVRDPRLLAQWHARHRLSEQHPHVHGANLGLSADAYRLLGGFGSRPTGEDVALVTRARRLGLRVRATDATRVRTSGRLEGRAPSGFAGYLSELALGQT